MDITAILRIINQVVPEKYQPAAIVALILGGFGWKVYQAKNTKHEDLKTAIKDAVNDPDTRAAIDKGVEELKAKRKASSTTTKLINVAKSAVGAKASKQETAKPTETPKGS